MPKKRLFVIVAVVVILILFNAAVSFADLQVSRRVFDLEIFPGGNYEDVFYVTNNGEEPDSITVYLSDWSLTPSGRYQLFKAGTLPSSLMELISFSPAEFELQGGETRQVSLEIRVPEEEEGSHWGMLFVRGGFTHPNAGEGQYGVEVAIAHGIKVHQTNPQNAVSDGRIGNLTIVKSDSGDNQVQAIIEFINTGTIHLRPEGQLEIRNEIGETVRGIEIEDFPVLPGTKRILTIPCGDSFDPGNYVAIAIMDYGGDHLVGAQRAFEIGK